MDYNTKYKIHSDLEDLKQRAYKLHLYLTKKMLDVKGGSDEFNELVRLQIFVSKIEDTIDSNEYSKEPEVPEVK